MPNKKKKTGVPSLFKIVILLLLLFSGYVIFKTTQKIDIGKLSLRTEEAVKKGLSSAGVKQASIKQSYQIEKISSAGRWIKFIKTFSIKEKDFYYIKKNIEAEIDEIETELNLDVETTELSSRILISYKDDILNELNFNFTQKSHLVAVIVDDVGYKKNIRDFIELDIPLTFAVLPGTPYSTFMAEQFKKSEIPYILHMPMEPLSYPETDPGEIALFTGMDRAGIKKTLDRALKEVPGAKGINNHMGSKFTSDQEAMSSLMDILAEKGLIYIDSYTSKKSVGEKTAKDFGVPTARSNIFLDNKDEYNYIAGRMELLKETALKREKTIAICHATRKNTAQALADYAPMLKKAGIRFVPAGEIIE